MENNDKKSAEAAASADKEKLLKESFKTQYGNYVALLRAFVNETPAELPNPEGLDWNLLLQVASRNNTMGIIGYMILQNPQLADASLRQYAKQTCFQEIATYAQRAQLMNELIEKMNKEAIDHLLFKGFVVRDYYNPPELRTFGDIDFIIRKPDRERCDAMMKQLGYEPHENWEPVYSYVGSRGLEYYEIHTDVLEVDVSDKADYTGYYSHIWEYAVKKDEDEAGSVGSGDDAEVDSETGVENGSGNGSGSHTYEFTPEFHFVYLLTHIAKHLSASGAGIRMYMDLALFIRHFGDTLDWKWVKEQLKILCFEDFGNIALASVERWFGVKSPIELRPVEDEVLEDFTAFTLEAGIFGKVGRDKSTVFLKQQGDDTEEVSRFKTLIWHAFPPATALEHRYSYLQNRHWLLPFAWVHRVFDNKDSWGRYKDTAKGIMNADEEEVVRLKRMYKDIGL